MALRMPAYAQENRTEVPAKSTRSGYLQDSGGLIVRGGSGLCWRSGYGKKEDAVAGCDGPIAPPLGKMIVPSMVGDVAAVTDNAVPAPIPTRTAAAPCEISAVPEGNQAFAFDSAEMNMLARQQLDQEVIPGLSQHPGTPARLVTGHRDRLGPVSYSRQFSRRRLQAVVRHLEQRGVREEMEIVGTGASRAQQECEAPNGRLNMLKCHAPDRRVEI